MASYSVSVDDLRHPYGIQRKNSILCARYDILYAHITVYRVFEMVRIAQDTIMCAQRNSFLCISHTGLRKMVIHVCGRDQIQENLYTTQ